MKNKTVCIVGLGYVGLPLAKVFSKHLKVLGYDMDSDKIENLNQNNTKENIEFTSDLARIKQADFVLICVNLCQQSSFLSIRVVFYRFQLQQRIAEFRCDNARSTHRLRMKVNFKHCVVVPEPF